MFGRASDQQTINTLRALHANGMLSGNELDDQIAADLLSGSSPASPTQGQARKGSLTNPAADASAMPKKRDTPSRLEPIRGSLMPRLDFGSETPGGGPIEGGTPMMADGNDNPKEGQKVTNVYMQQLAHDCENFNNKIHENTSLAKELMQKELLDVFVRSAQERLPDCFLQSLPKFGRGANKLVGIFNRSLNKKKTDTVIDRKEAPFELQIQDDILEEIRHDIERVIEIEMQRCFGVITTDMQKILKSVVSLKSRLETLEESLATEQAEMKVLRERLRDSQEQNKELLERINNSSVQAQEKETQMDILSDQVKRRNQMLDEQRTKFHREVMRYKSRIYELHSKLESMTESSGGLARRHSLNTTELDMNTAASPQSPKDNYEVLEAVDTATRELREQMMENVRKLKAEFAREKKELQQQKKLAIDERDNEIYHLKMNIKSMDRIIEVEKRRLMKNREMELKEIQEKYEQKIATMQSEIDMLKKGFT